MVARSDSRVLSSWHVNADGWTRAVRDRTIERRKLVTDAAVVDAVLALRPVTVLDIARELDHAARRLGSLARAHARTAPPDHARNLHRSS